MPRGQVQKEARICVVCGGEFLAAWGKKTTCSDQCRRTYAGNPYKPVEKKIKHCVVCGNEYRSNHGLQKACSDECKKRLPCRIRGGCRVLPLTPIKCAYCGVEFMPRTQEQRCCCDDHGRKLYRAPKKHKYVCQNCGKDYFTAYRDRDTYCSRECFDTHKVSTKCLYCGIEFMGSVRVNKVQKYCCDEHRKNAAHFINIQQEIEYSKPIICSLCSREFVRVKPFQIYCSKQCSNKAILQKANQNNASCHLTRQYTCKECGQLFIPDYKDKRRKYCSDRCCGRSSKRAGKAARRARIRNGNYEMFDPFDVFERDGWHCQLCGIKTPKKLRGTLDDRAPELDHIVPLALGGDHTLVNTQCSCRKCNQAKGAKVLGQLRFA